jgi:hypothetical protein
MRNQEAFARAIKAVSSEAEALKAAELAREQRRKMWAKYRSGVAWLLWLSFFGTICYYHKDLQEFASKTFFAEPTVARSPVDLVGGSGTNGLAAKLRTIGEQAAQRDGILLETSQ